MGKFLDVLKTTFHEFIISWTEAFSWTGYKKHMDETKFNLVRMTFTDKSTVGELWVDGDLFCFTLEDTCRSKKKIPGETAIPSGTYEIVVLPSKRFGRPMPHLLKVPYYEGIEIHWGNDPQDTEGCILVGDSKGDKPDWIGSSRAAFDRLFPVIEKKLANGKLYLTVMGGVSTYDFNV